LPPPGATTRSDGQPRPIPNRRQPQARTPSTRAPTGSTRFPAGSGATVEGPREGWAWGHQTDIPNANLRKTTRRSSSTRFPTPGGKLRLRNPLRPRRRPLRATNAYAKLHITGTPARHWPRPAEASVSVQLVGLIAEQQEASPVREPRAGPRRGSRSLTPVLAAVRAASPSIVGRAYWQAHRWGGAQLGAGVRMGGNLRTPVTIGSRDPGTSPTAVSPTPVAAWGAVGPVDDVGAHATPPAANCGDPRRLRPHLPFNGAQIACFANPDLQPSHQAATSGPASPSGPWGVAARRTEPATACRSRS